MAKRLNARSVKSRQSAVLRYIVSTDIDKTASDLGVSTNQLQRFARSSPETVRKHPERYSRILSADTKQVARENDVKLVQRLSGKRLKSARKRIYEPKPNPRLIKAVRLSEATRERRRIESEEGKIIYAPVKRRAEYSRNQIITNLGGMRRAEILDLYNSGEITESEAKTLMRKLYRNSGLSAARADSNFE